MNLNTVQDHSRDPDPNRWLALVALCLSTLVLVIDAQALTVATPVLARDLHAGAADVQWINASYLLVLAGTLLTGGSLADRFGRRRSMIAGLVVFGAASVGAAFAPSVTALIAARAVMGAGGALVLPSTLSILITVFDEHERPRAIAAWSAVSMVGLVGGPILAGVLVAAWWWGAVFLLSAPVAALSIVAAIVVMPESTGPKRAPDLAGAVLSMVALAAIVWTIISLPAAGLTPALAAVGAAGLAALAGFVAWERRCAEPMVPLSLFAQREFSGSCLSLTLVYVGYGGLLLALTQYLQFVLGYTAVQAGLALVPMAVGLIAASAAGGPARRRIGDRRLMALGFAVMAAGFLVLSGLGVDAGFAVPALGMAVIGVGAGFAQLTAISVLMRAVPEAHAGVGSALNDTMQQAGSTLGVAILGSVLAARFTAGMPVSAPPQARASVIGALARAQAAHDPHLARLARAAFTSAMSLTVVVGAALVLVAAILSIAVIRNRRASAG